MANYKLSGGNVICADQAFIDEHHPDAVLLPTPVINNADIRKQDILARLSEIDRLSDTPRARREALLSNTAWLSSLDTEAAALRVEFSTL